MRFLMTVNGGVTPPDQQLYAEMERFVEELTGAGVLLATGGLDRGTHATASGGNVTCTQILGSNFMALPATYEVIGLAVTSG